MVMVLTVIRAENQVYMTDVVENSNNTAETAINLSQLKQDNLLVTFKVPQIVLLD